MIPFPHSKTEIDPLVIAIEVKDGKAEESFTSFQLIGKFRRVWPTTGIEVAILQKLKHRLEKFAPFRDHGVIITEDAFQSITGRGDR